MKIPRVDVICVGTELLGGKINTHTAYLGEALAAIGLTLSGDRTVGDDREEMRRTFRAAFRNGEIIVCCGGLGPTFDDLTRDVWSDVTGRKLILHPELISDIREKFRARGIDMPPNNRRQGQILDGAAILPNPNGTAPGQFLMMGRRILILLPGPPRELNPMMEDSVLPRLKTLFPGWFVRKKSFHCVGVPESAVDEMIRPLVARTRFNGCMVDHSILASQSVITVKFQVKGDSESRVDAACRQLETRFRKKLKNLVYGEDGETLPEAIGRLLRMKRKTVSVTESCTGGLISKMITDVSGSSEYFIEGVVSYANQSKVHRLDVKERTLARFGSVSSEVAKEMAKGMKRFVRSDFALSVTGLAGPTGGTPEKPVGLVYIGCAGPRRTIVREFRFQGDREWIRHRTALMALEMLRKELV